MKKIILLLVILGITMFSVVVGNFVYHSLIINKKNMTTNVNNENKININGGFNNVNHQNSSDKENQIVINDIVEEKHTDITNNESFEIKNDEVKKDNNIKNNNIDNSDNDSKENSDNKINFEYSDVCDTEVEQEEIKNDDNSMSMNEAPNSELNDKNEIVDSNIIDTNTEEKNNGDNNQEELDKLKINTFVTNEECQNKGIEINLTDMVNITSTFCESVAYKGELIGYKLYLIYKDGKTERYVWQS